MNRAIQAFGFLLCGLTISGCDRGTPAANDPSATDIPNDIVDKVDKEQAKVDALQADDTDWDRAMKDSTLAAYKEYLHLHADGSHAAEARLRIEKLNTCNCSASNDQFRCTSEHSWVEFRMPEAPQGTKIQVEAGAYNKYVFPTCNRVYWSDLVFTCTRGTDGTCAWVRDQGKWDADALCHGSKGNSEYVVTGDR